MNAEWSVVCVYFFCAGFKCSILTLLLHLCLNSHAQPFDLDQTRLILIQPSVAWKRPPWRKSSILTLGLLHVSARDERNTLARNMKVWKIKSIWIMKSWCRSGLRRLYRSFHTTYSHLSGLHRGLADLGWSIALSMSYVRIWCKPKFRWEKCVKWQSWRKKKCMPAREPPKSFPSAKSPSIALIFQACIGDLPVRHSCW